MKRLGEWLKLVGPALALLALAKGCAGTLIGGYAPTRAEYQSALDRIAVLETANQDEVTWRKFHEGLPPPEGHRHAQ